MYFNWLSQIDWLIDWLKRYSFDICTQQQNLMIWLKTMTELNAQPLNSSDKYNIHKDSLIYDCLSLYDARLLIRNKNMFTSSLTTIKLNTFQRMTHSGYVSKRYEKKKSILVYFQKFIKKKKETGFAKSKVICVLWCVNLHTFHDVGFINYYLFYVLLNVYNFTEPHLFWINKLKKGNKVQPKNKSGYWPILIMQSIWMNVLISDRANPCSEFDLYDIDLFSEIY